MPELDLDGRLGAARAELLASIETPELSMLQGRAAARRRRRHGLAVAGAAVVAVLVAGTGVAALQDGRGSDRLPPAGTPTAAVPSPPRPTWRALGITLLGLTDDVTDLPGELTDVEFADADRGYALAVDCGKGKQCTLTFASTVDSGLSWRTHPLPAAAAPPAAVPTLVPLDSGGVVLAGATDWFSADGGLTWSAGGTGAAVARVPDGGRLGLAAGTPGTGCTPRRVDVLGPDGTRAPLIDQPAMHVCWLSPYAAPDGSWWVGGSAADGAGRVPAVAVSRDGGNAWRVFRFPGPSGSWGKVSVLGREIYATVVSGDPGTGPAAVHGLHRSANGGVSFAPYGDPAGLPTVVGDLVPLLDGRLVAAGPGWRLSETDGTAFGAVGPDLPWVGRLQRTEGGWMAYDLFASGWAAFTTDGATWHKIHLR